jgi:hypothetical protein
MTHDTHRIARGARTDETNLWLRNYGAIWVPEGHVPGEGYEYLAVLQPGCHPVIVKIGDVLCWDGARVRLHASCRQGVETCEA